VEATYETQVQTHSSLEPHGAVAKFEADGSLTVWCSTQGTFGIRGQAGREELPGRAVAHEHAAERDRGPPCEQADCA